jgi:hypothetical protein
MYSGTFTFYRNRKIATKSREFNCATRSKYTKFEDLQLIWDLINELFKKDATEMLNETKANVAKYC